MNNLKMTNLQNGNGLKGINFDAWGGIENFLRETSTGAGGTAKPQLLRRVVPWLAKANDMTALAVASLPFVLQRDDGSEFDSSREWQNRLGGIPSPEKLFYKLASSLCLGKAYAIPQYTSRMIVDMHYCAPHTVVPLITVQGLQQFSRTSDWGASGTYAPMGMYDPEEVAAKNYTGEMIYFWLPDADVEIGPAKTYPGGTALLASELITAMDSTLQIISERGFVPPTLLSVKGMVGQGEREKTEAWYNRFLRRWTETVAKIINSDTMDIKTIGAGMEDLKGIYTELKKQAIEDVGTAHGIPAALFMSDMAFATEVNPMIKIWYSTSVFIKIYTCIQDTLSEQMFSKYGLKMKFLPDTIDAFQEDETSRAAAYGQYVGTGMRPSLAAEMLGLELPEGVEYEALDEKFDNSLSKPETPNTNPMIGDEMPGSDELNGLPGPANIPPALTAKQINDLALWSQMSIRFFRKGKGKAIDFECKALPESIAAPIRAKLEKATTEADIIKAFEIITDAGPLLSRLDKLLKVVEK